MTTVKIDLEEIERLLERRRQFNSLDLKDVEFYRDGAKVEIPSSALAEWETLGLSNCDFVRTKFWEDERFKPVEPEKQEAPWVSFDEFPKKECVVLFKLANGQTERGSFRVVYRKDGLQMAPIGADNWLAWGCSIIEWQLIEELAEQHYFTKRL